MTSIEATLYAPHLPTKGVSCLLDFIGQTLHVQQTESVHNGEQPLLEPTEAFSIPLHEIAVSTGGFHDNMLFLTWPYQGAQYSAVISDEHAQCALADSAPGEFATKLNQCRGELRYHRNKWHAVMVSLGVLAVAVLVGWWQSDAITAWLATKVSQQTEERMGNSILVQLQRNGDVSDTGLAANTVKDIGERLTQGSRYHYQWYVKTSSEVNAFALPGGIVVVNSALIEKATTGEELAAVLAHEVQHIEYRHTLQQLIHSAGWAAVLAVTLGDVSAITGIFVHQLGDLRNSRKLESEADAEGVKALARARIPLDGMLRLMKTLEAQADESGGASIALLQSHPATRERVAEIENLIRDTPCDCRPLTLDWHAVQESLKK